jgi:large conductance mechanosensitive channel
MNTGFKQFLLRGNVIDLAVAVVIGGAFGTVVSALVKDLLTPLLAAIGGQPDFSALAFTINGSRFAYGDFINAILSFLIISGVIYFLIVLPISTLVARSKAEQPASSKLRQCPECLSNVPLEARRCSFCTSQISSISKVKTGT